MCHKPEHKSDTGSLPGFYSRPAVIFIWAIAIIFVSEFLVMVVLARLPTIDPCYEALIDASLLSIIIVPAFYVFVYLPLKANIGHRRKIEMAQQQMLEIDRVKSQFISTAAHELGTPLSSVMGYSELLLSPVALDEADRQKYLQTIFDKSLVLDRLVTDLLDLSRIDSGQVVRIEKTAQPLLPIIESVAHYFQYTMPDRQIETLFPAEELTIQADAVRIGQVLENLISNAIKYSPDGGTIKLEVEDDSQQVCLVVTDQGIGMTPEQSERIFDKFYRADCSNTATDGLGLGMTIVREIVIGHAGSIRVDSVKGSGTSVRVTLPRD